jgi:hypothetical protein
MELTSDLGAIKFKILDRLRDKPCRERIIEVDVYLADNDWGWSARAFGKLSNDDLREFIAAKFAAHRALQFLPE